MTFELKAMKTGARRALLNGPALRRLLTDAAEDVAEAAGEGHAVVDEGGRQRARAAVLTVTRRAMHHQARNNTLGRALAASRRLR